MVLDRDGEPWGETVVVELGACPIAAARRRAGSVFSGAAERSPRCPAMSAESPGLLSVPNMLVAWLLLADGPSTSTSTNERVIADARSTLTIGAGR